MNEPILLELYTLWIDYEYCDLKYKRHVEEGYNGLLFMFVNNNATMAIATNAELEQFLSNPIGTKYWRFWGIGNYANKEILIPNYDFSKVFFAQSSGTTIKFGKTV